MAEPQAPAPAPVALERIREFAILADQILGNPAVLEGLKTELKFEALAEGPPGRGAWSFVGPNEYLLRALLLDVRNVIQRRSDLELGLVLDDLAAILDDPEARAAIALIRDRFAIYGERSFMFVQDGEPVRPDAIVRLWMYAAYHHRELAKIRQLRALHPFERLLHQQEFIEYLRNVCSEVMNVRHLIAVAANQGMLEGVEIPPWREAPPQQGSDPRQVALLALMARVAEQGGAMTVTSEEIELALVDYGGVENATLHIDAAGGGGKVGPVQLRVGTRKPNKARPASPGDPLAEPAEGTGSQASDPDRGSREGG